MLSREIKEYLAVRNYELSTDEILKLLDLESSPQIEHVVFENGTWQMWDNEGNSFTFKKRNW